MRLRLRHHDQSAKRDEERHFQQQQQQQEPVPFFLFLFIPKMLCFFFSRSNVVNVVRAHFKKEIENKMKSSLFNKYI